LQVLQHAITLSSDEGYVKYMYLGQLLEGEEALAHTRKGVQVLHRAAEAAKASTSSSATDNGEAEELSHMLCGGLCSLAEMVLGHADTVASVAQEVEGMLAQVRAEGKELTVPDIDVVGVRGWGV
jgi:hypothetical protein